VLEIQSPNTALFDLNCKKAEHEIAAVDPVPGPRPCYIAVPGVVAALGLPFWRRRRRSGGPSGRDRSADRTAPTSSAPTGATSAWRSQARGAVGAEGFVQGGVHASYLHTHWTGLPGTADRVVAAAARTAQRLGDFSFKRPEVNRVLGKYSVAQALHSSRAGSFVLLGLSWLHRVLPDVVRDRCRAVSSIPMRPSSPSPKSRDTNADPVPMLMTASLTQDPTRRMLAKLDLC